MNVLSAGRETIAQALVWPRGPLSLNSINIVKRNENILPIRYDVNKLAPPCGDKKVGTPICNLSKNGNP